MPNEYKPIHLAPVDTIFDVGYMSLQTNLWVTQMFAVSAASARRGQYTMAVSPQDPRHIIPYPTAMPRTMHQNKVAGPRIFAVSNRAARGQPNQRRSFDECPSVYRHDLGENELVFFHEREHIIGLAP